MFDTFFGQKKIPPKQGKWKEFNKHAVLISVGDYMNDNKHGHWQEFYDTGELMFEEHYQHGVQHGLFSSYHRNGNLLSKGMFLWGSREGYFKVFDEGGVHIKSLLFFENKLIEEVDETRKNIVAECGKSED
jgi:antitoxin component YwqK of YwqJK toxin-antitoxin module